MTSNPARARFHRIAIALAGVVAATAAWLVTGPSAGAATEPVISDEQVVAAKFGVASFLVQNFGTPMVDEPCPVVRQDQLGEWAGQYGLTPTTSGYVVFTTTDATVAIPSVDCGVDIEASLDAPDPAAPHAVRLSAMVIDGMATFDDVFSHVEGVTFTDVAVRGVGGQLGGSCAPTDPTLCAVAWHRDGLVVSLWVGGPAADIDQPLAEDLLVAMIPDAVANLAAYGGSVSGASPVPTVPSMPTPTTTPTPAPSSPSDSAPPPVPLPEPVTTVSVPPVPMPVPEPITTVSVPPVPMPVPETTDGIS